jgi:hypothetical protein
MGVIELFPVERIPPNSPKLLTCLEVGIDYAMQQNELWHSRLPKTDKSNLVRTSHSVFYAAAYQDCCFAVAIWTNPIARKISDGKTLELRRLAIAPDAPKFTATWMIAKMQKMISKKFPEICKLISYQDTEVHTGTIYAAANWKKENVSSGGQWSAPSRKRKMVQTDAPKVRWAYFLRDCNGCD